MKTWPSVQFIQGLAGGSFLMASYNLINNLRTTGVNAARDAKITEIKQMIDDILNKVGEAANIQSNGNVNEFNRQSTMLMEQLAELENKFKLAQELAGHPDLSQKLSKAIEFVKQHPNLMQELDLKNEKALAGNRLIEHQVLVQQKNHLITSYTENVNFISNNIDSHLNTKIELYKLLSKNIVSDKNNKFTGDNIWDLFDQFNQWLNSINPQENLAFVNLSGVIFIMFTLISIIMIFYGNILLDYFQLEKRLPRIAKLIIQRRKFQSYYLLTNILLISVVSIIMFALNLTMLLN